MTASYRIGDASVTRISETVLTSLAPSFLYPKLDMASLSADERRLLLGAPEEAGDTVHLSVHSWLVQHDGQVILIDTGIGNHKDRPFSHLFHQLNNPFLDRLRAAGIAPEQVDHVLMTHLHVDHVGWNTQWIGDRWVPTFRNAKYVFPELERHFFATPAGASRRMIFADSVLPVIEAGQAETIRPAGEKYLDAFTFLPTAGHSVGHMAIAFDAGSGQALFSGDVMHNPIQVNRPDLDCVFCAGKLLARKSRKWLLDHASDHDATVFTAHFPESSAGKVRRGQEGFAWDYL